MKALFANVPVLDTGAHGSTLTFTQRGIGDVLVGWENDAYLSITQAGPGQFEIVMPSLSILANRRSRSSTRTPTATAPRALATAYLEISLFPGSPGPDRPPISTARAMPRRRPNTPASFPNLKLVTVGSAFGGWAKAQPEFFGDGGIFDQVYVKAEPAFMSSLPLSRQQFSLAATRASCPGSRRA